MMFLLIKRREEWQFCYKEKKQGYYFILYIGNGKSTIGNDKSSIGIQNGLPIWDNFFKKKTLLFPDGRSNTFLLSLCTNLTFFAVVIVSFRCWSCSCIQETIIVVWLIRSSLHLWGSGDQDHLAYSFVKYSTLQSIVSTTSSPYWPHPTDSLNSMLPTVRGGRGNKL